MQTSEEENEEENEKEKTKEHSRGGNRRGSARSSTLREIFSGLSFILTRSTGGPARPEDSDSEAAQERSRSSVEERFDKKSLRQVIEVHGGTLLSDFPTHSDSLNVSTLETSVLCVSPGPCVTMNYLLCLAHAVPIVSHLFILDSVRQGALVDRAAYLLPAGFSSLLMREVEQGQDNTEDLRVNECLLPLAPANRTRQSRKGKDDDSSGCRKILSGLHVLVISRDKRFSQDWQSVLDSLGASVTARHEDCDRLHHIRVPDVVVTDSLAPPNMCKVRTYRARDCILLNIQIRIY